ncbi:potassium-transporting ATPase KdpC subunit [Asanoa ishikariensis]|uniref:Potassium-transporting ATPase KdpC subunit n=1 Tax=Asanoa ishikariensis TaxID=137265 RepID=A0A1H3R656_9ACTN|nr:potassium-transporting ATPase subunit C [Asanoa ishikariensis]GIF64408.1 potassium-transporting ATPase KdpC subunit [Asanoa ishikariensis]SDZ20761.1 K+-transporting ATPase ATPase C chain [Asanoa ishikariensis]
MRLPNWLGQHIAAFRAVLVFTVVLGIAYPLLLVGIGLLPGLHSRAEGSFVTSGSQRVGSKLIGQSFVDDDGNGIPRYFQSRPSAAGDGYDPTASSASNLGPESIEDVLPVGGDEGTQSLLTQVCARSLSVGALNGVSGARPFCTSDGVGAVLRVFRRDGLTGPATRVVSVNEAQPAQPFLASFEGVRVESAVPGEDYSGGVLTPVRGSAPRTPAVPSDAVTASGSGLDPHITPAYAQLQLPRVARERGATEAAIQRLVDDNTAGRSLGFMGAKRVNVVRLNLALDQDFPVR